MCCKWLYFLSGLIVVSTLSGCTNDSAARLFAQQNAAAELRQQEESKTPTPDNQVVYLGLIKQMQAKGLYFASLAHIDAYEKQYGNSSALKLLQADALRETQQTVAAEATYRELLSTSESGYAWHGLGLLAAKNGHYKEAVPFLLSAVKEHPTDATALSDLGFALLQTGDVAGARVPLAQAAELAPDNGVIVANFALMLSISGDNGKAQAVMSKINLPAKSQEAVYSLAKTLMSPVPVVLVKKEVVSTAHGESVNKGGVVTPPITPHVASAVIDVVDEIPLPGLSLRPSMALSNVTPYHQSQR
ncbi:MAG: tetratricopeptide repeat protein [Sulfuriferula sp.]|nr:tetratricopeptide repeat protein [Sulfuriferula sp.]